MDVNRPDTCGYFIRAKPRVVYVTKRRAYGSVAASPCGERPSQYRPGCQTAQLRGRCQAPPL
jgi:hypothetical protein